jgi:3-hydroxybutyryl-CoA dehydrogenase
MMIKEHKIVGVIGGGSMGSGIAQVAATAGLNVFVFDTNADVLDKAKKNLSATFEKLVEKNKLTSDESEKIQTRIVWTNELSHLKDCTLVIEAIIENLAVKQTVFKDLSSILSDDAIVASNTSSLSITALANSYKHPSKFLGLHFFNPAPLMPLVEVIPGLQSKEEVVASCYQLMKIWNKVPVIAKDTPGFIVNRVARPFYGEALRIVEEQIASIEEVDTIMKTKGGFKMGPFELMDLIGNDINYTVTETVWTQTYYDPRYKPSQIQKKMVESGRLGRKTGQGYYAYSNSASSVISVDDKKSDLVFYRVLAMLVNEAADALYYGIATKEDIDIAMTKGVNYPKGLLAWADEIGLSRITLILDELYEEYREDRYRVSVLLKKMAKQSLKFYSI